jgi:hypothetical protein
MLTVQSANPCVQSNPHTILLLGCARIFLMPQQKFTDVQRPREEVMNKLKVATDTNVRQQLLREMRRLLADADRVLKSDE